MQKFEYHAIRLSFDEMDLQLKRLNEMGQAGWELISVLPTSGIAFFKRTVPEPE